MKKKFNRPTEAAFAFASLLHSDQLYGKEPYSRHLMDVVETLIIRFNVTDKDILCAAYLHDAVEDTGIGLKVIEEMFGARVAELVFGVTDEEGVNRKERKAKTYPKIKRIAGATMIKLADRIANVEHAISAQNWGMLKMYQKEQPEFAVALRVVGELDEMWSFLDALFVQGQEKINNRSVAAPAPEK